MAKLGFLGLGLMGYPMAEHLLDAGHQVALWSHTESKARKLAQSSKNAVFAKTPRQVGKYADCIFLCVGDSEMSEGVLLGRYGVIEGIKPGAVVADCSTIAPSVACRIAKEFERKKAYYLDAPCTGSTPGATSGTLTFMIGGRKKVFESVREYFLPMGQTLFFCGPQGAGLHAKLSQNLVLANMMQGFVEGIVLARKAGVDPELMLEVLNASAAKAGLISFKAPAIFQRNFKPAFPLKWMYKDVGLMLDSGHELGVPLPATGLVRQMFGAGLAKGYGEEDLCAAVKIFEEWAGVEVRGKEATGSKKAGKKKAAKKKK